MVSFFKQERIVSKENRDRVAREGCSVWSAGGCWGRSVSHHLKTRGAGGDDRTSNLLPACPNHHRMIHDIGTAAFAGRFWPVLSIKNRVKLAMRVHGITEEEARARYAGAGRFE